MMFDIECMRLPKTFYIYTYELNLYTYGMNKTIRMMNPACSILYHIYFLHHIRI